MAVKGKIIPFRIHTLKIISRVRTLRETTDSRTHARTREQKAKQAESRAQSFSLHGGTPSFITPLMLGLFQKTYLANDTSPRALGLLLAWTEQLLNEEKEKTNSTTAQH